MSRRFLPGRLYKIRDKLFSLFGFRIAGTAIAVDSNYFHIDTHNYHERTLFSFGRFERGTANFIKNYVGHLDKGLVVDVGANIGIHTATMCAARVPGSSVHVMAIEANPDMVARLSANLKLNGFRDVHLVAEGVDKEESYLQLGIPYYENDVRYHNPGIASMVHMDRAVRIVGVVCRPLDDIVKARGFECGSIRLIKMDIEGKELDALKGMKCILSESDAALIMEYNRANYGEIESYLKPYGYNPIGALLWYGIDSKVLAENILFMKN